MRRFRRSQEIGLTANLCNLQMESADRLYFPVTQFADEDRDKVQPGFDLILGSVKTP